MSKKTLSVAAMIVSILLVLFGLLTLVGAVGGNTGSASSAPWNYDSGYASFGGDFYTYVNNNTAEAASAVRTVAGNLDDVATLLKSVCGAFLMGFGLLSLCFFGMIWVEEKKKEEETPCEVVAEAVCKEDVTEEIPAEEICEDVTEEIPAEEICEDVTEEIPAEEICEDVAEEIPTEEVTAD